MTESLKHPPIQFPLLDYSEYSADAYPVRHRHRTRFSPNPSLSEGYHRLCDEIRTLDSRLDELMHRDGGNLRLLCEACASNIHWSTKLEGNPLTLEQVKHITELFAEGTEQEIGDGPSQEVMSHLHQLFGEDHHGFPWTSEHIRGMHRMLMFGVDTDAVLGKVRTEPVDIVGADGFVYFTACPPADIGDQLDLRLDWLNSSLFDPICTVVVLSRVREHTPFQGRQRKDGQVPVPGTYPESGLT